MKKLLYSIVTKILAKLAKHYINKKQIIVIGITWSIGKTSARLIISQTLQKFFPSFKIYTSSKNFNWEVWLSFSIFEIESYGIVKNLIKAIIKAVFSKPSYDIILLEYWIDHPGEMQFLTNIVKPDFSIITWVDKVHSENFQSLDQLVKEKYFLTLQTKKTVFINYNDEFWPKYWNKIKVDKFLFTITDFFQNKNIPPDIYFENYHLWEVNWQIGSEADLYIGKYQYHIKTNLIWKENFGYIGIWLAIAQILAYQKGIEVKLDKKLFLQFNLLPWRFSIFKWIANSIIIDSSYNAAPKSMKKVLENTYNIKQSILKDAKMILVLGEMRELWDFAESEHRKLASLVSQVADAVYLLGNNTKYLADELEKINFQQDVQMFKDAHSLWKKLQKDLQNIDWKKIIVFKWSQNTIFLEEAIKYILKDSKDAQKLPRQDSSWLLKKQKYFEKTKK